MSIEKREKLTWFQRLRRMILGKEKPNRVTRISVGIGFLVWIYLASWQILTLMALTLMGSLKKAEVIEGSFNRVGSKLYHYSNTIERLTIHNIVQLASYLLVLFALILIYRRKRIGFLLYVIGNAIIILATIFILGLKYFQHEMTYTYISLIGVTTLYFGIGAIWFYKIKPSKKKQEVENSYEA